MSADRSLTKWAGWFAERTPGARFEIIGGLLLVTPPPDAPHARILTDVMASALDAGIDGDETTSVLQKIAVWLPTGPEDHAVPDLSVVEADIASHMVENNCYDPSCFRIVLEVTAENPDLDLGVKVPAYAAAGIPVYVIVDRTHQRLHVLTDPAGNGYENHRPHAPGEIVALPDSIGAKVTLDVAEILKAGQAKKVG
ncbi:Uma2 family endonuclease [Streptomyces afghaniensis]|uniref:Uma2 family endonuclease n=1 Tax=Streptomyces afghaniensis TaxID=66865 RepID=UPI00277F338E|nr:Uma2 family endonuclease [Streptomyces afghaniensis]MDQ1016826.1 Uma2 family endonuclease [Streptomyces afghaniensis]